MPYNPQEYIKNGVDYNTDNYLKIAQRAFQINDPTGASEFNNSNRNSYMTIASRFLNPNDPDRFLHPWINDSSHKLNQAFTQASNEFFNNSFGPMAVDTSSGQPKAIAAQQAGMMNPGLSMNPQQQGQYQAFQAPTAPSAPGMPTGTSPVMPTSTGQASAMPTAPSNMNDLEKQYQTNLQPSQAELGLQQQYDNLLQSRDLGIEQVRTQPIAMPFITGQSAAIQRQAAIQSQPLQQRLALEQAKRQSALEASKFALSRADEQMATAREESRYQQQLADQKAKEQQGMQSEARDFAYQNNIKQPFYEIGGTIYRTSDNKAYSTPQQFFADGGTQNFSNVQKVSPQVKPVELSEGQRLVDPTTGQVIASAPKTYAPSGGGSVSANPGDPDLSTLDPKTATNVRLLSNQFKTEPIVKTYNTVASALQFVRSISDSTKNPADNQGIIYAFAKAMDPDSVVREGEYATVQKYAQSMLDSFGFNAMRVINNQEFLTPEAIRNLKTTIEARSKPIIQQYENLYNEYGRRLNLTTGQSNGTQYLTNYSQAFTPTVPQTQSRPSGFVGPINPNVSTNNGSDPLGVR
jgi:hypothetical protein